MQKAGDNCIQVRATHAVVILCADDTALTSSYDLGSPNMSASEGWVAGFLEDADGWID